MKVALIAPKGLHSYTGYGDMQFIIPDNVVGDFYQTSQLYKMLDNGVYENSLPIETDRFVELAQHLKVDEVVLPDVIMNEHETVRLSREFISTVSKGKMKYAVVPQARTPMEWIDAYRMMSQWDEVDVICIPVWLQKKFGCRAAIVHKLVKESYWNFDKKHHLIGLDGLGELYCYQCGMIRSVDTSLPFSRAFSLLELTFEDSKIPRVPMAVDTVSQSVERYIWMNIQALKVVAHLYA